MSWESRMVELLVVQRRAGTVEFSVAWRRATANALAEGLKRPQDFRPSTVAKNADDAGWVPFSTFFREACRAEWEGRVVADYLGLRELLEDSSLVAHRQSRSASQSRIALVA